MCLYVAALISETNSITYLFVFIFSRERKLYLLRKCCIRPNACTFSQILNCENIKMIKHLSRFVNAITTKFNYYIKYFVFIYNVYCYTYSPPANAVRPAGVGLVLGQHHRWWPGIVPALVECIVLAALCIAH